MVTIMLMVINTHCIHCLKYHVKCRHGHALPDIVVIMMMFVAISIGIFRVFVIIILIIILIIITIRSPATSDVPPHPHSLPRT